MLQRSTFEACWSYVGSDASEEHVWGLLELRRVRCFRGTRLRLAGATSGQMLQRSTFEACWSYVGSDASEEHVWGLLELRQVRCFRGARLRLAGATSGQMLQRRTFEACWSYVRSGASKEHVWGLLERRCLQAKCMSTCCVKALKWVMDLLSSWFVSVKEWCCFTTSPSDTAYMGWWRW